MSFNLSLRQKQTVLMMITASVALLLACIGFAAYEVFTFRQDAKQDLQNIASRIAEKNIANITFDDAAAAEETLQALTAENDYIVSACIYSESGAVFAKAPARISDDRFPPVRPQREFKFDGDQLTVFEPVELKGEIIGGVFVEFY